MVYKSFQINCLIRLILITANLYLFFYLLFQTKYVATTLIIGILPVFQIVFLFRFVNQTNNLLAKTFESIKYESFSEHLNTRLKDLSFKPLCDELNRIVDKFQETRLEKEQQFQYLKAIVHQTGMGLISIKKSGEINLMNQAARKMLKTPPLKHIREIESLNKAFADLLLRLPTNEKAVFDFNENGESDHLAVYTSEIRSKGEHYQLVTIQNIQKELEEKEMDAWKKLIRVLSHEIMNSITPISSLATTANLMVKNGMKMDEADASDLRQALSTIEKRSQGLMRFVQNYRRFARIPAPNFQVQPVRDLFRRIENLTKNEMDRCAISFESLITPENLKIKADANLIEQVLLNLTSNAIEAVQNEHNPRIFLQARVNSTANLLICVIDNGCGIEKEVLPKVFIPFFSTKSEGSGIGLSLSRQIMRLHGGSIRIDSESGKETRACLLF